MGGTTWHPINRDQRTWILEDGNLLTAPQLEESGSGRRVRLEGRQDTSTLSRDMEKLVNHEINRKVYTRKTSILTCVNTAQQEREKHAPETQLALGRDKIEPITCVWVFQHASLPLIARITVCMRHRGYGGSTNSYSVSATLTFDAINQNSYHRPHHHTVSDERCEPHTTPMSHLTKFFTSTSYRSEPEALHQLRDMIDTFETWDKVHIPDMRSPSLQWFTLDFSHTNVEGQLVSDIAAYLDSAPTAKQVAEKYEELRQLLRHLGLNLDERSPQDFQRALALEKDDILQLRLPATRSTDGGVDESHNVFLHLLTGTVSATCASRHPEEVADNWKLARFEAEMRDELEAFLAFHRAESDKVDRHNIIQIISKLPVKLNRNA